MKRAEVMSPSQPSFWMPAGRRELVGDVLAEAGLAEAAAGDGEDFRRALAVLPSAAKRGFRRWRGGVVDLAAVVVKPRNLDPVGVRRDHLPRYRLSSAVPHSTAFLPPAFIDTLPPMVEASAEVGSTANTRPAASATSITRLVTTPAPQ